MIDESRTLEIYGYTSDSLSHGSHKRVVAVCEGCGKYRVLPFQAYHELCHKCASNTDKRRKQCSEVSKKQQCSDETRRKMSKTRKSKPFSEEHKRRMKETHVGFSGRKHSDETKKKIGIKSRMADRTSEWRANMSKAGMGRNLTDEAKKKISVARIGKKMSEKTKRKISANHQGILYEEWGSYACEKRYCPNFNESCRESNREKYGRRCFICGLPESENIDKNGKQKKLSVHHVGMDKNQGCNGVRWKLVPVCMAHHYHTDLWAARFIYLLNSVWCG